MGHLGRAEAAFDGRDHEVSNHHAGDAGIGDRRPSDDLAVARVEDEEDAYDLPVAGVDPQMI